MLHYHGTPITPNSVIKQMAPNHFCVSSARPDQAEWCLANAQSVMWDNGAFSFFTRGEPCRWDDYYRWLEPRLFHPHWAVVPDVIGGTVDQQRELVGGWPFDRTLAAPVYHMDEPIDRLLELCDGWPRVAIGGSVGCWVPGSEAWVRRMDEAWTAIQKSRNRTWVHMLRAMNEASCGRWPFASADSAYFGRNHSQMGEYKFEKLRGINRKNPLYAHSGQGQLL